MRKDIISTDVGVDRLLMLLLDVIEDLGVGLWIEFTVRGVRMLASPVIQKLHILFVLVPAVKDVSREK